MAVPYLYVLPFCLLFLAFRVYPLLYGLFISFTNATLGGDASRFVGTDGRSTRLVGRDPALASLVATRPVVVRVFDPATGVLTAPAVLD